MASGHEDADAIKKNGAAKNENQVIVGIVLPTAQPLTMRLLRLVAM